MDEPIRSEDLIDGLLEMAPHLVVAHHVPGRARLKVLPRGVELLKERKKDSGSLDIPVKHLPGVRKLRTNYLARSVVVEYDADVLTNEVWTALELVRQRPDQMDHFRQLLERLFERGSRPGG